MQFHGLISEKKVIWNDGIWSGGEQNDDVLETVPGFVFQKNSITFN